MLFKAFTSRPKGSSAGRALLITLLRSAAASLSLLLALAVPIGNASAGQPHGGKPDPELMLIDVYKALGSDHLHVAQEKAQVLVQDYPNFHLAQLIYGDLLMMNTHVVDTLGDECRFAVQQKTG